jgi:hypothetical protein
MKKYAIFAALMALVAMAAVPAMASAVTLTNGAEEALPPNTSITGTSTNLPFTTESGELNCESDDIAGEILTNGAEEIEGEISSGSFQGASATPCRTTLGEGAVTADVTGVNLPWTLRLKGGDVAEIAGAAFTATFTLGTTSIAHCTFEAAGGVVTGSYTTNPNDLAITVTNAPFNQVAPSSGCPAANGTLSGTFAVTANGGTVVAD